MSRLPAGKDLLATARETLLEQLLVQLPPRLHYQARMVANAMAIAAREAEMPSLVSMESERHLAASIRAGAAEKAQFALLVQRTRDKLAVTNPRMLVEYAELFKGS